MFEIELKFAVQDSQDFLNRIASIGGVLVSKKLNADHYFNHPSRDFAQSGEALRVRREDDVPMITYKGPKLPGEVKAREELEWRLDPGDTDGTRTEKLLERLGFRDVAIVRKQRSTFRVKREARDITITLDNVDGLGTFAEVECVIPAETPTDVEIQDTREMVLSVAAELNLSSAEPRSYLRMILEKQEDTQT